MSGGFSDSKSSNNSGYNFSQKVWPEYSKAWKPMAAMAPGVYGQTSAYVNSLIPQLGNNAQGIFADTAAMLNPSIINQLMGGAFQGLGPSNGNLGVAGQVGSTVPGIDFSQFNPDMAFIDSLQSPYARYGAGMLKSLTAGMSPQDVAAMNAMPDYTREQLKEYASGMDLETMKALNNEGLTGLSGAGSLTPDQIIAIADKYPGMSFDQLKDLTQMVMSSGGGGDASTITALMSGNGGGVGGLNPYIDQLKTAVTSDADRATKVLLSNLDARAAGAGMSGGSRHGIAQAQGMNDINSQLQKNLADVSYNAWDAQQNRILEAGKARDDLAAATRGQNVNALGNIFSFIGGGGGGGLGSGFGNGSQLSFIQNMIQNSTQSDLARQGMFNDMVSGEIGGARNALVDMFGKNAEANLGGKKLTMDYLAGDTANARNNFTDLLKNEQNNLLGYSGLKNDSFTSQLGNLLDANVANQGNMTTNAQTISSLLQSVLGGMQGAMDQGIQNAGNAGLLLSQLNMGQADPYMLPWDTLGAWASILGDPTVLSSGSGYGSGSSKAKGGGGGFL